MKLWDKGGSTHEKIDFFTVGNDRALDLFLAPYDVKASMAHAEMLATVGLLEAEEAGNNPLGVVDHAVARSVWYSNAAAILHRR